MGRPQLNIGVLTSSRADYGIYYPLLKELEADSFFNLELLVFGSHLSERFGYSFKQIKEDKFKVAATLETLPDGDSPASISESMGRVLTGFSAIWEKKKYDIVLALGDRYEMFAAVASTVPFNIRVGHIHGGETTRGAIDNAFRHSITHMSYVHFTASEKYAERVIQLFGSTGTYVYNTGSLSVDNLEQMKFLSIEEINRIFSIDLSEPTILLTFHPETVGYNNTERHIDELCGALKSRGKYNVVITMPNSDTGNRIIRERFTQLACSDDKVTCVENLGSPGYLSFMKHCKMVLGNSSSGFIEASYFPIPVVNIGRRQDGRIRTPNIIDCDIERDKIVAAIRVAENMHIQERTDIYGDGSAAKKIISALKEIIQNR